jgi:HD superfamily phosphohydrolase YqeK
VDPNDLIDTIVDAIDYAENGHDANGLIKARRLLNNDLRQAIDRYIEVEISKALQSGPQPGQPAQPWEARSYGEG